MGIRDQLKGRKKREIIDLGTDDAIYVKSMSGADRAEFFEVSQEIEKSKKTKKIARKNAVIIALSLVNESGELIYSLDDIDEIISLESSDIDAIVKVSMRVNKLDSDSQAGQEKN